MYSEKSLQNSLNLYEDIKIRTNGEIYIGVVGPVRTGKSTFIKRFMEMCVIPNIEDDNVLRRTIDELPQSGTGNTIMTTEPKFIPGDTTAISINGLDAKLRMVDCVGFMVDGALGVYENGVERLVHTPWVAEEIPFSMAAKLGTEKVIEDHSTVGVVVTTDGSFTGIERDNYIVAEEMAVEKLKKIGKPFIIILNTTKPYSAETKEIQGCPYGSVRTLRHRSPDRGGMEKEFSGAHPGTFGGTGLFFMCLHDGGPDGFESCSGSDFFLLAH